MRRANGTGTIVKLSGNRRRPYAVRIATVDEFGQIRQRAISYHSKMAEAQEALDAYNRDKAAGLMPRAEKQSVTLGQVYALWSARKYQEVSPQAAACYCTSWSRLCRYENMRVVDLTIDHLQAIIDEDSRAGKSQSTINKDKVLMCALFRYAMERDIITKDYSQFVRLPSVKAKFEKGAFNDLQMARLEEMAASGFPWADTVLILCYTGFRINEFLTLTPFSYHADGDYLQGGSKTDAGKNRIIPVHPKIKTYLGAWLGKGGNTIICEDNGNPLAYGKYVKQYFQPVVKSLGVPQATPHWCRHTFASRLHAAGAPDLEVKRLMGHSNQNITEHYTHTDIAHLRKAILMLA